MSRAKGQDIGVRRFTDGDSFRLGEIKFRVMTGRKAVDDLRIDWWVAEQGKWVAIPMSVLFLLVDFMWENEHVLYPPSRGYQGGDKLWQALRRSWVHGWRASQSELASELRRRLDQPSLFDSSVEAS